MAHFIDVIGSEPLNAKHADDAVEIILAEAVRRRALAIYFISTRSSFVLKLRTQRNIERLHHFSPDSKENLLRSLSRIVQTPATPEFETFDDEEIIPAITDEGPWGRITRNIDDHMVDFRVTFLPCELGKDVAIQITYPEARQRALAEIFTDPEVFGSITRELNASYGLYVVAGPPFSGKRTTAWAMLQEMNPEERHIVSIESPIRRLIPGVSQIEVNTEAAPDYVDALQAIRYHQPDAVYIDAIEDDVVLQEILRTVNHGHLVVANIPTGDIAETLSYLRDLHEPVRPMFRAMRLVTAQRLIPVLSPEHRQKIAAPDWLRKHPAVRGLKATHVFEPVPPPEGAPQEPQYVPVIEVLHLDEAARQFLKRSGSEEEIREYLTTVPGFQSMRAQALRLAVEGKVALQDALEHTPTDVLVEDEA